MIKTEFTIDLINEKKIRQKEGSLRPSLSKRKFAEIIFLKYPEVFKDIEDARYNIRAATGSCAGNNAKKTISWD